MHGALLAVGVIVVGGCKPRPQEPHEPPDECPSAQQAALEAIDTSLHELDEAQHRIDGADAAEDAVVAQYDVLDDLDRGFEELLQQCDAGDAAGMERAAASLADLLDRAPQAIQQAYPSLVGVRSVKLKDCIPMAEAFEADFRAASEAVEDALQRVQEQRREDGIPAAVGLRDIALADALRSARAEVTNRDGFTWIGPADPTPAQTAVLVAIEAYLAKCIE